MIFKVFIVLSGTFITLSFAAHSYHGYEFYLADPSRRRRELPVETPGKQIVTNGDVVFGGLFPMHEAGPPNKPCGAIKKEKGIQRLEAMLYAVDLINRDSNILPNVTVGVEIKDTCSTDNYALEQSMDFIRTSMNTLDISGFECRNGETPTYNPPKPVAGVIGAASSQVSIMVANILRLFKIPQISYASTSSELSDKSRFDYFSRVVPPDTLQAKAMVDIVKKLGWEYVSTVAVEGNYGEKGIEAFEMLAKDNGICIATSEKIQRNAREEDYHHVIKNLESKENAKGVILFVDEDNCRKFLSFVLRTNKSMSFNWVGSDSWGAKIHPVAGQEISAEGAITILPKRVSLTGFDSYFTSLNLQNNKRNVWFSEFWEAHFNCLLNSSLATSNRVRHMSKKQPCTGREVLTKGSGYEQEGLVPFVVDAVYAMANAIHKMKKDLCPPGTQGICQAMKPVSGERLLRYIRGVDFIGQQNTKVRFKENGDAAGSYELYQYQRLPSGRYDYRIVGFWADRLFLEDEKLRWRNASRDLPVSVCSAPCEMGYKRHHATEDCCWLCIKCDTYEFLPDDYTCQRCREGSVPNRNKTGCIALPVQFVYWYSLWAIVPMSFAVIGVATTMFVIGVFIKFNSTPVIMASGRELCYVLLIGINMCYLMTFVVIAKPSVFSCALLRVGLGLCLVICYSAIFTKTNRISRIFNHATRTRKRPSYTSPRSQIVICMALVSVQLVGAVTWLIVSPPRITLDFPDPKTVVLRCGVGNVDLIVSLVYNMLLILLCTTYAFKTRKIPENFNEAKYIGFSMYSTCIVWLAFVPIYFGTNNDYRIQTTSLCMCVSISASVALGCLFTPKIYIVLFQPYKNVRGAGSTVGLSRGVSFRATKSYKPVCSTGSLPQTPSRPELSDSETNANGEVQTGTKNSSTTYGTSYPQRRQVGRRLKSEMSNRSGSIQSAPSGTTDISSSGFSTTTLPLPEETLQEQPQEEMDLPSISSSVADMAEYPSPLPYGSGGIVKFHFDFCTGPESEIL